MTDTPDTAAITHEQSRLQLTIDATRDDVWKSLTKEIGEWWPDDFHFSPAPNEFVLEPRAGGRVYETGAGGFELLWGTILAVEPGKALNWHSVFSPPYSGPADSYIHIALEDTDGGGTRFVMTQHYVGVPTPGVMDQMEEGWKQLFDVAMRKHLKG